MRPVLGQPPIAGFHGTEVALDDAEGILDLGARHDNDPVDFLVDWVELAALRRLAHDAPDLALLPKGGLALGADTALVRPDRLLFAR